MTEITGVVIRHEDIEAALARLRDYSGRVHDIEDEAARGSMQAAADIELVYNDDAWVTEHLAAHPIKVAHKRGQPIDAASIERFSDWVKEHPEKIGDVYSANRISKMMSARRIALDYFGPQAQVIYSVNTLAPLKGYLKDRKTEIPAIVRRVNEITDGGSITEETVRKAIKDHNRSLIPAKVADAGHRTPVDHAAIIRAEFRLILKTKRFRDAGQLVNELRAMLMEAAGVSDAS